MIRERAVFLDKDGTLVENVPYNIDPTRVKLAAWAAEGLQVLHQAGYKLVVVSNQAGVAHGYFPEGALQIVEESLREKLDQFGLPLHGFYYCPHHPEGKVNGYAIQCECRKPRPGLLLRAARELQIDLASSWMVGDILDDVEAGRRAGCRTVLIDCGGETQWQLGALRRPHALAGDLLEAAYFILCSELYSISEPVKAEVMVNGWL